MAGLTKKLFSPPSLRLNTTVVFEVTFLLVASLAVLFSFSYNTLKEESMKDAEQTLEGTVQHVDNVLMNVEQSAGNIYWEMLGHLDEPDRMFTYCQELLDCTPNVQGCAIAFQPGYYPGREQFMAYMHRKNYSQTDDKSAELVRSESFGSKPYTEQEWYSTTMQTGRASWVGPLKEEEDEGETITFCIPIYDDGPVSAAHAMKEDDGLTTTRTAKHTVGVFAIDLSVELLSAIVHSAKPSPNSYSVLLNEDGEYVIHQDKEMLKGLTAFDKAKEKGDSTVRALAEAMVAGQTGSRAFTLDGNDYYSFYKPFVRNKVSARSADDLKWSIALIYPEQDLFGMFSNMFRRVLIVAVIGLLLFFLLCRIIFRKQMKPLRKITETAMRIAEGHYDNPISDSKRNDEIGRFQQHFQTMQQALAAHVSELEQMKETLQHRGEKLRTAHEQIVKNNEVKNTLLRKMSDKMIAPAEMIGKSVDHLCDNHHNIGLQEANREVDTIKVQGEAILTMLGQMLDTRDEEEGKEVKR